MARRRKPALTQAQLAELERQKAARKREVERLIAQGLDVKHDAAWNIIVTRRIDVFALLHERKAMTDGQFLAVRRLEKTVALAMGHERPEQSMDRVDASSAGAPGQNVTQAMIDASADLDAVYRTVGPLCSRLLQELLTDQNGILTRWRNTVWRITAETNDAAQAAAIRLACESLALAWQALDYRARERRERAA